MVNVSLALALSACLLSVFAQKSGWTCGTDGYWYENGVRSSFSGCSGDKTALDQTDSYESGAGTYGEKSDTYTSWAEKGTSDTTDKSGTTAGDKTGETTDKSGSATDDKTGETTDKSGTTADSKSGGTDGNYGWTCANGVWVDPQGAPSTHSCVAGGKSLQDPEYGDKTTGNSCTVTAMRAAAMASMPRTCVQHPSFVDGRCWWTHVPSAVASATDGRKVPLLVDMHGGGGCASDQYESSGFKALADANATAAGGGIIVVWPQGGLGGLWASAGTSSRASAQATGGKALPEWNDIGFLEQLVAYMIRNSSINAKIDPERVYVSGFSLGCMMAHRFALERSQLVAAFGCHGGELSLYPTTVADMNADKTLYNIQAMPAYLTIGDADAWYSGANASWYAWKYWNGCSSTAATALTTPAGFTENVASSCQTYSPALQTVMMVIQGGPHAPDTRAYEKQWLFMSQYKRTGALTALSSVPSVALQPNAPAEVVEAAAKDGQTGGGGGAEAAAKDGQTGGEGGSTKSTVGGSHTFHHTWNGQLKTRSYDLVEPVTACSGNPRGMVVILQPGHGSCSPLNSLAAATSCIIVACPYSVGSWKAMGPADTEDVEFIAALIQNITTRYSAPAGKVIVTGFSYGGSMAYRLACNRPDVVGAVVPYGQTFFEPASGHVAKDGQDLSLTTTQQAIQMMQALSASDRCNPASKRPHFALVGLQDVYYGEVAGSYKGKTLWEQYSTTVLGCSGSSAAGTSSAGTAMTGRANSVCYGYSTCSGVDPSLNKYCTVEGMGHETTGWSVFAEQAFNQIWGTATSPTPSPASGAPSPTPSPASGSTPSPTPSSTSSSDGAQWQHCMGNFRLLSTMCFIFSSSLV